MVLLRQFPNWLGDAALLLRSYLKGPLCFGLALPVWWRLVLVLMNSWFLLLGYLHPSVLAANMLGNSHAAAALIDFVCFPWLNLQYHLAVAAVSRLEACCGCLERGLANADLLLVNLELRNHSGKADQEYLLPIRGLAGLFGWLLGLYVGVLDSCWIRIGLSAGLGVERSSASPWAHADAAISVLLLQMLSSVMAKADAEDLIAAGVWLLALWANWVWTVDVFGSRWLNCSENCYGYYLALSLVAACCGGDSLTPASAIDAGQVLLVLLERFPCFSLISWRLLFAAGGVPSVLMTLLAAGADLGDLDVLPWLFVTWLYEGWDLLCCCWTL
ncbi:hypothetical protein Nepgr_031340 [Nepenthes gracilis]|uniref:Transmembrane protein n=1 Tax=Nepenthes gracilis TaxID=150966 RepID=A0AAD3THD2_NEPGR|nr:hypothetical protein Nepgr_031340 [Nepenthes gracilis]